MRHKSERSVSFRGRSFTLPDDNTLERFKAEFPFSANEKLRLITGKNKTYNSRLAAYLGLEKSPEYLEQVRTKALMSRTFDKPRQETTKKIRKKMIRTGLIHNGEVYELITDTNDKPQGGAFRNCLKCDLREFCELNAEDATASSLCGIFFPQPGINNQKTVYYKKQKPLKE